MQRNLNPDPRLAHELDVKISEATAKIHLLNSALKQFSGLVVGGGTPSLSVTDGDDEEMNMISKGLRRTGRLKIRLQGAVNLSGKRSGRDGDYFVIVRVDGSTKATSRSATKRIDESFDIQVSKAQELEFAVYEKYVSADAPADDRNASGSAAKRTLLAFVWFSVAELEEDLQDKLGEAYSQRSLHDKEFPETWLDMEPGGQLSIKINFMGASQTRASKEGIFRRQNVQKVYPRNGHKFAATQFYNVMQCAVCNEFMSGQGYQCQSCEYAVHPRCYGRVITKCITKEEHDSLKAQGKDTNTGQLLRYNIPHRMELAANLSANWCYHCGYILPIGSKKVMKCLECSKSAHKDCAKLIPSFCGLSPDVADKLVAAFEEQERRAHEREMMLEGEAGMTPSASGSALPVPGGMKPSSSSLSTALEPVSATPSFSALPQSPAVSAVQSPPKRGDSRPESPAAPAPGIPSPYAPAKAGHTPPGYSLTPIAKPATVTKTLPDVKISLKDFNFISVLGRGAFGKVMLASDKITGSYYAIKALKKEFIIQSEDVKSVKLEKRIFQAASAAHHPFLVNLHSSFQTEERIYFVMEYVSGGDLMCHIQDKRKFPSGRTKFYACQVLLALEYFHKNNIIYRDLKLDNILMTPEGHIKVADYGICKDSMAYGQTTRTFCGTPDYMAPEILLSNRYGRAVDWWSFGVLIFVMLAGRYPFHGEDENQILDAILDDSIEYPSNLPRETFSIISQLLNKNPSRRLGAGKLDAEEVKRHPYFTGADWDAMLRKEITPPWKPTIKSATDVSNFDAEFTKEKAVLTPITSVLAKADQD
ncbi:MAG: hypothetical protein SGCHY_005565, partial [Lobulomycetales sp.]